MQNKKDPCTTEMTTLRAIKEGSLWERIPNEVIREDCEIQDELDQEDGNGETVYIGLEKTD